MAWDRKKKASSKKSGVKNESKKGNVYSSEGLTCGTDLPAASSTLTRRQGIERKSQVAKYQVPKIIQENKNLLYIEDDIWVPFCRSGLNVSKAARDRKKMSSRQKSGGKKNPKKKLL